MPADYYRIDLRITPSMSLELEKLQKEVFELYGRKVSKADLIREMMKEFLENPSSSCFSNRKKT